MNEKVKGRLKSLFPKANLSNVRLDEYSAKLSTKITEETTDEELDNLLKDYNEIIDFEQVARNDDRLRTLENKPTPKPEVKPEEPKQTDDTPAWAKALQDEIASLKKEKAQDSLTKRFKSDERVKGLPESLINKYVPTKEEDFDTYADELKALALETKIHSYGADTTPASQGSPKVANKEEAKSLLKDILK